MKKLIRKTVTLTSLFWLSVFASCATTETIKTWVITDKGLQHHTDQVDELQTFAAALGYRCYSENDDMAWRDRMAVLDRCCSSAGSPIESRALSPAADPLPVPSAFPGLDHMPSKLELAPPLQKP